MRILCWNVRGLGSFVKKGMVKKIGDRKSDSIVDATGDKTRKGGIQCCTELMGR